MSAAVQGLADGTVVRRVQPAHGTYFGGRGEGDEWLDWSDTSLNLYNKVRGISRPGPGARTLMCDRPVIIWSAEYDPSWPKYLATPGQIVGRSSEGGVVVKTGSRTLVLREVQADAATIGAPSWAIGTRLGLSPASCLPALVARVAGPRTPTHRQETLMSFTQAVATREYDHHTVRDDRRGASPAGGGRYRRAARVRRRWHAPRIADGRRHPARDSRRCRLHQRLWAPVSAKPLLGRLEMSPAEALLLMDSGRRDYVVNQLPLVDVAGMAVGLLLRSDLAVGDRLAMSAVIMAGGFGKRLLPLTERVPKPLLPVGDRPLLDRTINRMHRSGIRQVVVSTHYLADQITSHLGTGQALGVEISYLSEDRPLGTAGALRLLGKRTEPILVINGDILTGIRYEEMLAYHREQSAEVTVGVRPCGIRGTVWVLECDGAAVKVIREKPGMKLLINAGVYMVEPSVRDIPEGRRFDMTDESRRLLDRAGRWHAFRSSNTGSTSDSLPTTTRRRPTSRLREPP